MEALVDFHFIRPYWLLLIIPGLLFSGFLLRHHQQGNNWKKVIDKKLLSALLITKKEKKQQWPIIILGIAWCAAAISLAGPAWDKLPAPIHKPQNALVIVLDLSPSMLAEDTTPSRLVRAKHKLLDILKERKEGTTALIIYSGNAHTITPLTDDTATIASIVPTLSPYIMPSQGSNIEEAIELSIQLLNDAGHNQGKILLMTDGISENAASNVEDLINSTNFDLSILGIGTQEGAPIPDHQGQFIKGPSGNIIIAKLDSSILRNLTKNTGGLYSDIQLTETDTNFLIGSSLLETQTEQLEREFDTWHDRGYWLVLLLLPIVAFSFRKGWLLSLSFLLLLPLPETSYAFGWKDLWQSPDQQGMQLYEQSPKEAANTFESLDWQAAARYKAEDYINAANSFAGVNTDSGHYNRGNALAKAGQLQSAIKAYESAIKINPNHEDAQFNKALVEKLLEQQENQQDQQSQDSSDQQQNQQQNQEQQQKEQSQDQNQNSEQEERQNSQDKSEDPSQQEKEEQQKENNQSQDSSDQQEEQKQQTQENDKKNGEKNTEQKKQQSQPEASDEQNNEQPTPSELSEQEELSNEQQQALEEWLRRVPDDPAGLLRNKLEYQYRLRQEQLKRGLISPSEKEQRW